MKRQLTLLHTGAMLIPNFAALAKELLADVTVRHQLDETLIQNTIATGRLEKSTIRRLLVHIDCARAAGADVVMVTCSSMGPAIAIARQVFEFPILRVDEAMAQAAVQAGRRIGVLATLTSTLEPTCDLVRETAAAQGHACTIASGLCPGAFEAVVAGDGARHDELVTRGLLELAAQVDVVVLAQASMARVAAQFEPGRIAVPVLSSPRSGMERARELLGALKNGGVAS